MPIIIQRITPADVPSAVHSIQNAFENDPYNNWVFDKSTPPSSGGFDRARNFASLRAKCEWGVRSSYALFYVAREVGEGVGTEDERVNGVGSEGESQGNVVGVSMWTTPAAVAPQSWWDWTNDWLLWLHQGINILSFRGWGGLRRNRYWIWKRQQSLCQDELWTDPKGYYFVNIVVVDEAYRGKGVGRKLFEVVMESADREGRKCYLESSVWEPNVRIYEKLGFEVRKRMRCQSEDGSGEGVELFCMVREPRGGGV